MGDCDKERPRPPARRRQLRPKRLPRYGAVRKVFPSTLLRCWSCSAFCLPISCSREKQKEIRHACCGANWFIGTQIIARGTGKCVGRVGTLVGRQRCVL